MTEQEKMEISQLPEKYRPISSWTYFWHSILYSLPLIGKIILIIQAISANNINLRSFARSYFCFFVAIFVLIMSVGGMAFLVALFSNL